MLQLNGFWQSWCIRWTLNWYQFYLEAGLSWLNLIDRNRIIQTDFFKFGFLSWNGSVIQSNGYEWISLPNEFYTSTTIKLSYELWLANWNASIDKTHSKWMNETMNLLLLKAFFFSLFHFRKKRLYSFHHQNRAIQFKYLTSPPEHHNIYPEFYVFTFNHQVIRFVDQTVLFCS